MTSRLLPPLTTRLGNKLRNSGRARSRYPNTFSAAFPLIPSSAPISRNNLPSIRIRSTTYCFVVNRNSRSTTRPSASITSGPGIP